MVLDYSKLGQVSAVTLDSEGKLIIFHRGDKVWNSLYVASFSLFFFQFHHIPIDLRVLFSP